MSFTPDEEEDGEILHHFMEVQQPANILTLLYNSYSRPEHQITGVDGLTGANIRGKSSVDLSNGKTYEACALADYLLNGQDHRDPITGYVFTVQDLTKISECISTIDSTTSQRVLSAIPKHDIPLSSVTTAVKYFEEMIIVSSLQLLSSCELISINSMEELQANCDTLWSILIRAFCGLLSIQPLSAAHSASLLRLSFSEALSSTEQSESYLYEQSVLLSIATSINELCLTVCQSLLKHTTKEALQKIQTVRLSRIVL